MHGMSTEVDLYCKLPSQSHVLESADAGRQSNPKCPKIASMTTGFASAHWQGVEQLIALNSKQSKVIHNATVRSIHDKVRCHRIGSGMIICNQMSRHDCEPAIAHFVLPAPLTKHGRQFKSSQDTSRDRSTFGVA